MHEVDTKEVLNELLNFEQKGNQDSVHRERAKEIKNEIKTYIQRTQTHLGTTGLPQVTKLPSSILQTLDLKEFKRSRHKSTLNQFKEQQTKYIELPELSGWMEKQSATGFKSWQKRWIIVRKTHMLWSKNMMDTANPLDPKERRKFNNSMTLLTIKGVRPVASKNKRKFDIVTTRKTYHFRCKTAEQRELWLTGLQMHLSVLADSLAYIRKSVVLNGPMNQ